MIAFTLFAKEKNLMDSMFSIQIFLQFFLQVFGSRHHFSAKGCQ